MARRTANRITAILPVVLSLFALLVVAFAVTTGWERGLEDEGAGAHIFQILIVAQAPFILIFLATADWRRSGRVAGALAAQVAAIGVALGSVAIFRL